MLYVYQNAAVTLTGGEGVDLFAVYVTAEQRSSRIIIKDFDFDFDNFIISSVIVYSHIADGNTYFKFEGDDSNTPILTFENLEHDFSQGGIETIPEEVPDDDSILRPDTPDENNVLTGTANADEIELGAGNDVAAGYGGNDIMRAGAGNDLLYGNEGNDELYGKDGNDSLYGHDGNDRLYGAAGQDYLTGDAGDNRLDGGAGNDRLYGGAGDDRLMAGAGNYFLRGDGGQDRLTGGEGADIFAARYDADAHQADIITDFDIAQDRLDFEYGFDGMEAHFSIRQISGDTEIYYRHDGGAEELIVTLEGVGDAFTFDDILFFDVA